jgi:predicted MFS family arabinose efflux permease
VTRPAVTIADSRRGRTMLLVVCVAAFLCTTNGLSTTPFLLLMSQEFQTDLFTITLPIGLSNIAWAIASLFSGQWADRFGRKPMLLLGQSLLMLSAIGTALSQDVVSLTLWRLANGLAGGAQMPAIYASASDLVPPSRRGTALGWVVTGQSLGLVIGTPICATLGAFAGWRWGVAVIGLAALGVIAAIAVTAPTSRGGPVRARHEGPGVWSLVRHPRIATLFASSAFERVCYASAVTFFATFLLSSYSFPLEWLGPALTLVALGNLIGGQIGGRLTDRLERKYPLIVICLLLNAVLALPMLATTPGPAISVALGFGYTLANAVVRPPLMWMMSELSSEARGAVLGFNVFVASGGWLIASLVGGWLIASSGFSSLGFLTASCALMSAAMGALSGWLASRRSSEASPVPSAHRMRDASAPGVARSEIR